ncbi:unnamed protein product [Sphagnum jensenii]|uniref:Uncharacterized protein n=1 Tax=Sphagnum jensenii TaxID=128206 RepID=A0ABP1AGG8_9BRYO
MRKQAREERRSLAYARDCTLRESTILNREMQSKSLRALLQGRNVLLSFETCKSSVRSDKSAVGKEDQDIEVVVYILES